MALQVGVIRNVTDAETYVIGDVTEHERYYIQIGSLALNRHRDKRTGLSILLVVGDYVRAVACQKLRFSRISVILYRRVWSDTVLKRPRST